MTKKTIIKKEIIYTVVKKEGYSTYSNREADKQITGNFKEKN